MIEHVLNINRASNPPKRSRGFTHAFSQQGQLVLRLRLLQRSDGRSDVKGVPLTAHGQQGVERSPLPQQRGLHPIEHSL